MLDEVQVVVVSSRSPCLRLFTFRLENCRSSRQNLLERWASLNKCLGTVRCFIVRGKLNKK